MTKEETLSNLKAYLDGDTAIGNIIPLRSVLESAIKYLEPSLPSDLDEAAKESAESWRKNPDGSESREMFFQPHIRGFKAGAEWMAGQGWTLEGEVKDYPTGGDDFEIYLDYNHDEMGFILDNICDYVNEKYPNDDNRYKVIIQIRKKQ